MIHALILDDDELFCKTLADNLKRNQELAFMITMATTAEEAREAVMSASQPFDVFLIDQRLGPGLDGIDVLEELRQLSPQTEAIIFTGIDEPEAGLRAYQSGAHRYLTKPFNTRELIWILRSLHKWQDTQYERDWLKILAKVAEDTQRALSVQEMARIIVQGGQRLGFERARLWLLSEDKQLMVGLSQLGNKGLDTFNGFRMPISDSIYAQHSLNEREPIFLQGRQPGTGYLTRYFAEIGFEPPIGEWVLMPLWTGEQLLGMLILDNASHPRPLRPDQRRLLSLFGHQSAAALERAKLFEQERRKSSELEIINRIGQHISSHAAHDDMSTLLQEVRAQVGKLMDVRNFTVVLLDLETGRLDYRLQYQDDKQMQHKWGNPSVGLIAHIIAEGIPLFLPHGGKEYRKKHSIKLLGKASKSWMGMPLSIEGRTVGAIVVESNDCEDLYNQEDWRLLKAVAGQVAGAIHAAYLKEQEELNNRRLRILHQMSVEMMALAKRNEAWLWHITLTAATANYALNFNRVGLFLLEKGGASLRGRMGIGHFETSKARQDWRKDRLRGLDFDGYLQLLQTDRLKVTPVEQTVHNWVLDLSEDTDVFLQVIREGRRIIVPADEAAKRLPQQFVDRFGITTYAVLPLWSGKILGLVVVDNIHNQAPLRVSLLDQLETLLAQAALILENLHQHQVSYAKIRT